MTAQLKGVGRQPSSIRQRRNDEQDRQLSMHATAPSRLAGRCPSVREGVRILAVVLFGSLVHGNWDAYSDIDCDIIVTNDVYIDALHELRSPANALANVCKKTTFIMPDDDAGDI
jgi:predicted nucleotidyltransferase